MIILGVDPGLSSTGFGIIKKHGNKLNFISSGTIYTKSDMNLGERLKIISSFLSEKIELYKPNQAALEETFVNKNSLSSLKLGHARGAIMLTLAQAGLNIAEYAATQVKKALTGAGRADKNQIISMLKILMPGAEFDSEHSADALAIAICHANHS